MICLVGQQAFLFAHCQDLATAPKSLQTWGNHQILHGARCSAALYLAVADEAHGLMVIRTELLQGKWMLLGLAVSWLLLIGGLLQQLR